MPTVSIIIPTHNRPDMLAEALDSVRAQTFTDYEIIVVSNGETPENRGRSQAVSALAGARWLSLPEGSLPAARNFGVAQSSGEWIAFLDDDDLWLPQKLERQLTVADETGSDVVSADCQTFGPDAQSGVLRQICPAGWSHTKAISHFVLIILPSSAIVRRSAFDAVGGFDERMVYGQDVDLWQRISWEHRINVLHDVLWRYRTGHMNSSHPSNIRMRSRCHLYHLCKMYRDTPARLRVALPSFWTFALPWLIEGYAPPFVIAGLRALRPRSRLRTFLGLRPGA